MARWLCLCLLIAVGYFLTGRLGQLLAVPPSYATAIWPASGIGLAGILLGGYRLCPGVFLGALMVNAWTPLSTADTLQAAAASLIIPISISCGATAQAVLGAAAIRRFAGFPNPLIRDRSVLIFLAFGAPLACLISATWGVGTLVLAGIIGAPQIALNWWTWWVGDVIGVIIFTPLMLICFAQPRSEWRSRRLSVALPVSVTFLVTTLCFVYMHLTERSQVKLQFERRVSAVTQDIRKQLDRHFDAVRSLRSLYASSVNVDRTEFSTFNRNLFLGSSGVQAMEWLPKVPHEQRDEYEARAQAEGISDFVITERGLDGDLTKAGERDEYYPVFYVEPAISNEAALGFDVASNPARRKALNVARDTARQIATGPITLVQESSDQTGCLVFDPIYSKNSPLDNVDERRQALEGYAVGVFRVGDIVEAAFNGTSHPNFHLKIVDVEATAEKQTIYFSGEVQSPHKGAEVAPMLEWDIGWSATLDVAGRQWQCDFEPTAAFLSEQSFHKTWIILASGVSFTGLLGTFLLILAGRTVRVEELVTDRTVELSNAIQELSLEVTQRQQAEQALSRAHEGLEQRVRERTTELKASEARYLDLYDNAPDMFISVDVLTERVVECNKTFLDTTNFRKQLIINKHFSDLFDLRSQEDARRAFRLFLECGSARNIELKLRCSNDIVLDISMNVSAVRDGKGESVSCRAVLRDITAKKHADDRLKQQEVHLAHVARVSTMGEMATGLAHEINQPLAAIAAYAKGAAIRLDSGNTDVQGLTTVVNRISADAHRASEVIRRLRQFVGKQRTDRSETDINELVYDVVQFVEADMKRREVTLRVDLADNLPPVCADTIQIQQVLLNLMRNGCDAMEDTEPSQRILILRTRFVEKDDITVEVEDFGVGLSDGASEHIFEAYYSQKEDGLGMGLAISRSIIESHNGRICATSTANGGASFRFSLPPMKDVGQNDE